MTWRCNKTSFLEDSKLPEDRREPACGTCFEIYGHNNAGY